MTLDIVNAQNEKVGTIDLRDEVFGGRVNAGLIWASVVRKNASERRGTHATKNRALVSGSGKKPWRQKGTGRARVGEIRNPLWRKGGTVFGPQPRSYDYVIPNKVERGALRAALAQKLSDGSVVLVESFGFEGRAKATAETVVRLGGGSRTLLIDVHPDENAVRSARNLAGVRLVPSGRVDARDVIQAHKVIITRAAIERLQDVLAGGAAARSVQEVEAGSRDAEAEASEE